MKYEIKNNFKINPYQPKNEEYVRFHKNKKYKQKEVTLIQISKDTVKKLKSLKDYPRESYNEIINKLINFCITQQEYNFAKIKSKK